MINTKIPIEEFDYDSAIKKEREGMMNCLNHILTEIEEADLPLVALHLKIAIQELNDASPLS